jgi:hypothetical protein
MPAAVRRTTPPKATRPSAAVAAAIAGETAGPSEDKLDRVRGELRKLRDVEEDNIILAERMSENNRIIQEMKSKTLVDLFDETGITHLGLGAEDNHIPYEIEIKPYYHANIAEEWEDDRKAAAYNWLDKNKHGDMLRNTVTIPFGKGTRAAQKALTTFLKKSKIEFSSKFGVPWNTLTAFVKEEIEVHERTPPLDILGATVGRVASVVKVKQPRQKKDK